jgi:hypothetical protein
MTTAGNNLEEMESIESVWKITSWQRSNIISRSPVNIYIQA